MVATTSTISMRRAKVRYWVTGMVPQLVVTAVVLVFPTPGIRSLLGVLAILGTTYVSRSVALRRLDRDVSRQLAGER